MSEPAIPHGVREARYFKAPLLPEQIFSTLSSILGNALGAYEEKLAHHWSNKHFSHELVFQVDTKTEMDVMEIYQEGRPEYRVLVTLHPGKMIYVEYAMPDQLRGNAFLCEDHLGPVLRMVSKCICEFLVRGHFGDLWVQTGIEDLVTWPEELQRPGIRYQVNTIQVQPEETPTQHLPAEYRGSGTIFLSRETP